MSDKKMLIDTTHPEETRVVVMSGNRIEDFEVEAADRKQLKGNIYLAKVTRVEPSLQAAFVDYGGNRHGFLAFSEIHPDYYQIPVADREALMAEQQAADRAAAADDDARDEAASASTSKGRRRGKAAEGEGEGGEELEVLAGDEGEDVEVRRPMPALRNYKIQEVIKRRQIMLVQVVKEERGSKGAALTTYLSLAGRYCVLMPNTGRGGGISRKIASGTDRKRLKTILGELDIPEGMAVIVRTAGAKRNKTEIKRDCNYLLRLWESVRELTLQSIAPALVYEEANLIKRTIRDLYASDIDEIAVDGEGGFQTAKAFIRLLMPSHSKRVKQHPAEEVPLFQQHGVEAQLQGIFKPDVPLKSGGYIVINPTEALVSIDVNSGRATRERNIEETALRTNLEAADEVARQVRLREMAGLIVIDFIDMEHSRNQIQVERRLKMAMRNDRARIQIGRISAFGLMELSRQRLHPSLLETCFEPFPHAAGVGYRRTVASSALAALRAIEEEGAKGVASELLAHVPTAVAVYIINNKRAALAAIEARHDMIVRFSADDSLATPELRIERSVTRTEPRPPVVARPAAAVQAEPDDVEVDEIEDDSDEESAEDSADETPEEGSGESEARTEPRARSAAADDETHETNADGTKRRRRRRSRRRRSGNGERDGQPGHQRGDAAPRGEHDGEHEAAVFDAEGQGTDGLIADAGMPAEPETFAEGTTESHDDAEDRNRRRRRGRRGGRRRPREGGDLPTAVQGDESQPAYYEPRSEDAETPIETTAGEAAEAEGGVSVDAAAGDTERAPRRRRSRRPRGAPREAAEAESGTMTPLPGLEPAETDDADDIAPPPPPPTGPRPYWASRPRLVNEAEPAVEAPPPPAPRVEPAPEPAMARQPEPAAKPVAEAEEQAPAAEPSPAQAASGNGAAAAEPPANPAVNTVVVESPEPTRRGWWKRLVP